MFRHVAQYINWVYINNINNVRMKYVFYLNDAKKKNADSFNLREKMCELVPRTAKLAQSICLKMTMVEYV